MRSPREEIVTGPVDLAGRYPVRQATAASALAQAACRFVSCVLWRTGPDWSIPHRRVADLFLFLPLDGALVASGPGGDEPLPVGSLAIVPPGSAHAVAYAGRVRCCRVIAIHAHITTAWGEPWPFSRDRYVVRLPGQPRWADELTRLAGLAQDEPLLAATMGRSLIRSLLVEAVLAGHPAAAPPTGVDPRLAAIIAALRADPGAAPPITTLARSQGIGPLRLRQLFQAGLGCSPKSFVDRLRLARAAEQLGGGGSVAAVARSCGFGSVRQLQVRFKSAYGCPPSAWAGEQRQQAI